MPHRPPLTAERLAQIWDEHPDPVVLELLWEIHRLRARIMRADQIRRMITKQAADSWFPESVWNCFVRELDAEPCLSDGPTPRQQTAIEKIVGKR